MAIEISSLTSQALKGARGSGKTSKTGKSRGSSASSSAGDTVSLTSSATQLQQLESRIASMSVVDARQVESVRQALATGSFHIDPEGSAEGLLFMEKALP